MHLDTQGPINGGVLDYLCGSGEKSRAREVEPVTSHHQYRCELGSHPDVVDQLWDTIAPCLPVDCRAIVCGRPVLAAPRCGVIFAAALGTEYALRLAPTHFALAQDAGAEVAHYYRTSEVTLDLARQFGRHWVFGAFDRREPEWCVAALRFAESVF